MRLLILSASAGAGHTRAAQALEAAAREIPGVEAEHWDVLAHVDLILAPPAGGTLTAFGLVSNVHELMAAADLAVTKSGGLTTSECLASGLPMVVRDPIPGQEERNCDYVLEAGAGVRTHGAASLRYKLGALLADPARLA